MSDFFAKAGRILGQKAAPLMRQSKWYWHSLTSDEASAIRAEKDFGAVLAREFLAEHGQAGDPRDREVIKQIGQRLSRCVRDQLRTFQFEAFSSKQPAAMALPGGFIFVGDGLLAFCQRQPDEVAFVLGHEMAHVIRKHAMKRIVRNVGVEVISAVLSRGALSHWLRRSGIKLLQSAHSQEAELEADQLGARMAALAGYDPGGAVRFFQRIRALREVPEGLADYFASHPPEALRMAELKAHWQTHG